ESGRRRRRPAQGSRLQARHEEEKEEEGRRRGRRRCCRSGRRPCRPRGRREEGRREEEVGGWINPKIEIRNSKKIRNRNSKYLNGPPAAIFGVHRSFGCFSPFEDSDLFRISSFVFRISLPMRVHLEYGRTGLEVELPDERVVRTLAYKDAQPLADPAASLRKVLEKPT